MIAHGWQLFKSLVFVILIYGGMAVLGLVFAPFALFSREPAFMACKSFCAWTRFLAKWMLGLRTEVRGPVPTGEVLVAAKHQSFLDILLIFQALPRGKFIMKRELLWTPVIGLYAKRVGCIPVNRGKRGAAIAKMVRDVAAEFSDPGQLVIYPQGTRVAPGVKVPYKAGTGVLYDSLKEPCYPVATNVGLFWPKKGLLRKPGLAVVEFLEPIGPGMERGAFMAELEQRIEERSDALMREGGFSG